jgi:PUA domain protein
MYYILLFHFVWINLLIIPFIFLFLFFTNSSNKVSLIVVNKNIKFFKYENEWVPTLHLLHQYPTLLPLVQVDEGAIKFVLKGADIMAPGLLSKGGYLPPGLEAGTVVAIRAEGKTNILAIGVLTSSSDEIRKAGKGSVITNLHFLNDGLWSAPNLE